MMMLLIAFGIAGIIKGLIILATWNQHRLIQRNYDREQEEYMKKHPDSYGIGELKWLI